MTTTDPVRVSVDSPLQFWVAASTVRARLFGQPFSRLPMPLIFVPYAVSFSMQPRHCPPEANDQILKCLDLLFETRKPG